jgi:UPF0755 protein
MDDIQSTQEPTNKRKKFRLFVFIGIVFGLFVFFWFFVLAGVSLEKPVSIHIARGDKVHTIAKELEDKKVIRSAVFLQSAIAFLGGDDKIKLGDYYFDKKLSLPQVAYRLARGVHNIQPIKITIPEGTTNADMVQIIKNKLPNIDTLAVERAIEGKQGHLFPDTYFFYPMTNVDEIVDILSSTYNNKTKVILTKGYKSYSIKEIEIMASIVEEEANGNEDRDIIAGILWKRLEKGMMLQVDVAPETYKTKGLPEYPITNFGLKSLAATINPKETVYLFYLHDKDGMIHLAKTFTEHKNNIRKYLR